MMRYFILRDDVTIPNRWHLGEVSPGNDEEPLELWVGKRMQNNKTLFTEITDPGRSLDFCLTSFATPVATTKLASAIEAIAGDDVQRLPVYIKGHEGFEVLNAVRVLECLDEDRSKFLKWTEKDHRADLAGEYRSIPLLRIRSAEVPNDAHFFRIKGSFIELIVSEDVKLAMEDAGCLGAKFQDVT